MHATILGADSISQRLLSGSWESRKEQLVDPKEAGAMVLASTGSEWCWLNYFADKPA